MTNTYAQKSVQLVRGSSFRSDFLQNPYFNKESVYLDVCCKLFCRSQKIKLTNSKFRMPDCRMQVTRNCSPSTNFTAIFLVRQFDDFFATGFVYFVKIESAQNVKRSENSALFSTATEPPIPEQLVAPYFKKEDTKAMCLVLGKVFLSHQFSLQRSS